MKNKIKQVTTTVALTALLLAPYQSSGDDPPPQNDWLLSAGVVLVAGIAVTGIYLVAHAAQPKYYWLMDSEQPPRFWVAAATGKECEINGWHRIGGPYNRLEDAPAQHPDPTNRVAAATSAPMNLTVESSVNGSGWQPVFKTSCALDDFGYFPDNNGSGVTLFRLMIKP